jgi:hypothetical protein
MNDTPITEIPFAELRGLEANCSDVIGEICRAVSCQSIFADGIREVMGNKDTIAGFEALRVASPEVAERLMIAGFGVLVNAINLVGIQDELERRKFQQN